MIFTRLHSGHSLVPSIFWPGWAIGLLILACSFTACSSKRKKEKNPFAFSSTTDYYYAERFEAKPKKQYKYLYAYNMRKVLYGNPCVTEVTRKYGFEYIPAFTSAEEPRNDLEIWLHNAFTSTRIAFRYGLFWKKRVRKKIRYCAESSGDFNG